MNNASTPRRSRTRRLRSVAGAVAAIVAASGCSAAFAAAEGGLYIAGANFSFRTAAERAIAENPGGRRFFVLSLPPETRAVSVNASAADARLRERVVAANGVLLVCQRDIDNRSPGTADLVPGVVPVRGWPPTGSRELAAGERYYEGENPADLPAANEALRTLRASCS